MTEVSIIHTPKSICKGNQSSENSTETENPSEQKDTSRPCSCSDQGRIWQSFLCTSPGCHGYFLLVKKKFRSGAPLKHTQKNKNVHFKLKLLPGFTRHKYIASPTATCRFCQCKTLETLLERKGRGQGIRTSFILKQDTGKPLKICHLCPKCLHEN